MVDHVRVPVSTAAAGGTWDVTTGSGAGNLPVACMFYVTNALADDAIASHAAIGWGAADGTNQACLTVACEDAQATTDTARRRDITKAIMLHDAGVSYQFQFSFNSWITDGVRLNIDNAAPSGYLLKVVFFYAADVDEAAVVNVGLGSTTSPINYTGLAFQPNVLFTGHIYTSSTSNNDHAPLGLGVVYDSAGAITQKSMAMCSDHGSGASAQNSYIDNTAGLCATLLGSHRWSVTFSNMGATGFTHTNSGSSSTIVLVLALKLAAGVSFDLFDATLPAVGNYSKSLSFEPGFGGLFSLVGPIAYNTFSSIGVNAAFSIATFDGSITYTDTITDHDGQDPTVSKSLSSDQLRILGVDGATDAVLAPNVVLSPTSIDATLTTNPAVDVFGFGWAISGGAGATPTDINPGIGSVNVAGQATGLLALSELSPGVGAAAIVGRPVSLLETVQLMIAPGTVVVQGHDVGLAASANLQPSLAGFGLSGLPVGVESDVVVSPAAGVLEPVGAAVSLEAVANLTPGLGAVTINGFAVGLSSGDSLQPGVGVLDVQGKDLLLSNPVDIQPLADAISLSGLSVELTTGEQISPSAGQVSASGQPLTLTADTELSVGLGSVSVSGIAVDLAFGFYLQPGAGSIAVAGQNFAMDYSTSLAIAVGAINLEGQQVSLNSITFYVDRNLLDIPLRTTNIDLVLNTSNVDL